MSKDTRTLQERLLAVGKRVGYVDKDGRNDFHKYDFTSHAAVARTVYPVLWEEGIAVIRTASTVLHVNDALSNVIVHASVALAHGDERAVFEACGQGSDKGDKAVMKANTAANKYVWQGALGLAWGDDSEADSSTDRAANPESKPKAKAKAPSKAARKPPSGVLSKYKKKASTPKAKRPSAKAKSDRQAELEAEVLDEN